MTGHEIRKKMRDLEFQRTRELQERMRSFDEEVYYPAIKKIRSECPHEDDNEWRDNGLGFFWTQCRWCGQRMQQNKYPEVCFGNIAFDFEHSGLT